MTLERGSLLNKRYRIVEILGQGGMAAVYRAIDENLGVEVAVKENLFTTDEYARQFRREAVILANLRHGNMPRVTDHFVIEQQGQYLIMDYIEGEDLRQRMERLGPLPEQEIIILGVALCEALSYLHTRNPQVLHRDIKPGNVKITPTGHIYLVDFGLAKVVSGRQATTTGARAMTPGYSPPEQYGTARTDHRSDIYSLGATLYSALTDTIPEDGLARAMDQAALTPLNKRNSKITRRLASAIEKALAVRPDDRYQSADDFKEDLLNARTTTRRRSPLELTLEPPPFEESKSSEEEKAAEGEKGAHGVSEEDQLPLPISTPLPEISFRPPSRPKRRRNWIAPLLTFLLLLIIFGGVAVSIINPDLPVQVLAFFQSPTPSVTFAALIETPTATPAIPTPLPTTSTATLTITPTPEPSYTSTVVPTRTMTPTPTIPPTRAPTSTPIGGGGGQIAFSSDRSGVPQIYLMNLDGKGLAQITDIREGACQPSWSPEGDRLVFISPCSKNREIYPGSSMFIINADGSDLTPLPPVPGGDFDPTWSPDGKSIIFVSYRLSDIAQMYILQLDNLSVTLLGETPPKNTLHPFWSPDGKQIVYVGADNQIRVVGVDGQNRFLLARNVSGYKNAEPVWSPDGSTIVFTEWSSDGSVPWLMAVTYSPNGAVPVKIPGSDYMYEPSFSPDGFWLVFTGYPEGVRDIYLMTVSGVGRKQLTADAAYDFDPAWRPGQHKP